MGCGKQGMARLRFTMTFVQLGLPSRRRVAPHPALWATFPAALRGEGHAASPELGAERLELGLGRV